MSNVPKARRILRELLTNEWIGERIKTEIRAALRVMTRRPHVRETPRIMNGGVTKAQRQRVLILAKNTELSQAEIARRVGLGAQAGGRVSEILHGMR